MSFLEALRFYYPLFGARGVVAAAVARLTHSFPLITIRVDGIRDPLYVRWRTSDVSVFRQVFVSGEYDYDVPLNPGVIVDAGANIGLTTALFANKYPEATILAVEPEPSNYKLLVRNCREYRNVKPLRAALWPSSGQVKLSDPGLGHYGFRVDQEHSPGRKGEADRQIDVESISIPALIDKFDFPQIDVLKLDIEGAEIELLREAAVWLPYVKTVVLETHDRFRPESSAVAFSALRDFEIQWQAGELFYFSRSAGIPTDFKPGSARAIYKGYAADFSQRNNRFSVA